MQVVLLKYVEAGIKDPAEAFAFPLQHDKFSIIKLLTIEANACPTIAPCPAF